MGGQSISEGERMANVGYEVEVAANADTGELSDHIRSLGGNIAFGSDARGRTIVSIPSERLAELREMDGILSVNEL